MRIKTVLTALFVAMVLVVGIDYVSYAANGSHAILGMVNKAGKSTTFQRTKAGPPVTLVAKPGSAPVAVNSQVKVGNLNSDLLDGMDSSAFATKSTTTVLQYTTTSGGLTHTFPLGTLTAGLYQVSYSVNMAGASATTTTPVWGECHVHQATASGLVTDSLQSSGSSNYTGSSSNVVSLSATGVIDASDGGTPTLSCTATKTWFTAAPGFPFLPIPVQIVVTPLASATVTTGTVG